jgi:hypothetical protein
VIYQVLNKDAQLIGQVAFEDPLIAHAVTLEGREIETWARDGVPSLQGSETALGIEETQILVSPADEFWGLAFLDEAERRDWTVQELPTIAVLEDFRAAWPDAQGHDDHGRVAYHGTTARAAKKILKEGILPQGAHSYHVSASLNKQTAETYAKDRAAQNKDKAVILELRIPHDAPFKEIDQTQVYGEGHNWLELPEVKPAWIKKVRNLEAPRAASIALALLLAAPSLRALWPDKYGKDDHGRDPNAPSAPTKPHTPATSIPGSEDWFASLVKKGSAKGSNPGGLYEAPDGSKWYVKEYTDPAQGAGEVLSSAIYNRLGLAAPDSVLGKGGRFASRWMDGVKGTVGQLGLTKERADEILDGFAADVFTVNWDAVGTGLDNVVVTKTGGIARVDQGGTLLHRAQGAIKPESVLTKIGEWDSLRANNHYYASVFSKAGINGGDALGARAVAQIDRITAARPEGGWRALAIQSAPRMPVAWHDKVGAILEARHEALKAKREALAKALGIPRAASLGGNQDGIAFLAACAATMADVDDVETLYFLASGWDESKHPRKSAGNPEGGEFTESPEGRDEGKKKKAKAATTEQIDKAWEMYQQGKSYAQIQAATGLNPKQAATIIFKVKKKQKEAGEAIVEKTNELSKFGAGGQKEAEAQVAADFAKQGEEAALGAKLAVNPTSPGEAHDALLAAGFKYKSSDTHDPFNPSSGEWHWIGPDGEEYGPAADGFSATNIAETTWKEWSATQSENGENSAGAKVAEILEGAGYEWKQDTTGAFGADNQAYGWVAPYGAYFGKQDWGSATDKNAAAFAIAQNSDYGTLDNVINKKIKMGMSAELKKLGYEPKLWSPEDENSSLAMYKWTGPDGAPIGESFPYGQGGKASSAALSEALAGTGGAFAEEGSGFSKVVEPPANAPDKGASEKLAHAKIAAALDAKGYQWEKGVDENNWGWTTPGGHVIGQQAYGVNDKDAAAYAVATGALNIANNNIQGELGTELKAAGYTAVLSPSKSGSPATWSWQAPDGTIIGAPFESGKGLKSTVEALTHATAAGYIKEMVAPPVPKTPSDTVPAAEFKKMSEAGYKVETINDLGGLGTGWQWVGPKGEKIGPVMLDVDQMQEVSKQAYEHFKNPPVLPTIPPKYTYTSIQSKDNAVEALQSAGLVWKKDWSSNKYVWVDKNGMKLGDPKSYQGGALGSAVALIKQNPSLWRDKANEGATNKGYVEALHAAGAKWGYDSATMKYGWYKAEDMGAYEPLPGATPLVVGTSHASGVEIAKDAILAGGLQKGSSGSGFAKTSGGSSSSASSTGTSTSKLGPNATKTAIAEEAGYEWKLKTTGPAAGKDAWAWFQNGIQVSGFEKGASTDATLKEKAAKSINFGAGPTPKGFKAPPAPAPTGNALIGSAVTSKATSWPLDDSVVRKMGSSDSTGVANAYGPWVQKLSPVERSAIESYTGSGYSSVNASLRQNPSSQAGANIRKGLDKAPSPPPPELVWRGVSHTGFKSFMSGLAVNDVIRMDGFQSTSINPTTAVSWGGGGTLLEIKPVKGSYVRLISHHPSEYEYLLPHGHKYRFRGAKQVSMNGTMRTVLQLEMLAN